MDESKLLSDEELREISELDDVVDAGSLRGVATGVVAEYQEKEGKLDKSVFSKPIDDVRIARGVEQTDENPFRGGVADGVYDLGIVDDGLVVSTDTGVYLDEFTVNQQGSSMVVSVSDDGHACDVIYDMAALSYAIKWPGLNSTGDVADDRDLVSHVEPEEFLLFIDDVSGVRRDFRYESDSPAFLRMMENLSERANGIESGLSGEVGFRRMDGCRLTVHVSGDKASRLFDRLSHEYGVGNARHLLVDFCTGDKVRGHSDGYLGRSGYGWQDGPVDYGESEKLDSYFKDMKHALMSGAYAEHEAEFDARVRAIVDDGIVSVKHDLVSVRPIDTQTDTDVVHGFLRDSALDQASMSVSDELVQAYDASGRRASLDYSCIDEGQFSGSNGLSEIDEVMSF